MPQLPGPAPQRQPLQSLLQGLLLLQLPLLRVQRRLPFLLQREQLPQQRPELVFRWPLFQLQEPLPWLLP